MIEQDTKLIDLALLSLFKDKCDERYASVSTLNAAIQAFDGHFYGFFSDADGLPDTGDTSGYAYVAGEEEDVYDIYNYIGTPLAWSASGLHKTLSEYDAELDAESTNAVQNKAVATEISAIKSSTVYLSQDEYDALVSAGTVQADVEYNILEE